MPNTPSPDPRLQRRRPSAEELERLTSADAMQNVFDDEAEPLWDRDSGLPGLLSAEPKEPNAP